MLEELGALLSSYSEESGSDLRFKGPHDISLFLALTGCLGDFFFRFDSCDGGSIGGITGWSLRKLSPEAGSCGPFGVRSESIQLGNSELCLCISA